MNTEERTMEKEKQQEGTPVSLQGSPMANEAWWLGEHVSDIVDMATIEERVRRVLGMPAAGSGKALPTTRDVEADAPDYIRVGSQNAPQEQPVAEMLLTRKANIREEERIHQEPAGAAPLVDDPQEADQRMLSRYALLQLETLRGADLSADEAPSFIADRAEPHPGGLSRYRFRQVEVRRGRPITLEGKAGLLETELSPDGMTIPEREQRMMAVIEEAAKTPRFTDPNGVYVTGLEMNGAFLHLQRMNLRHKARLQAWNDSMVTPQNLIPKIIQELGKTDQLINETMDNAIFRRSQQAKNIDFAAADYRYRPENRMAAERWLAVQPGAGEYFFDKASRFVGGVGGTFTDAAGGLGLALDAVGMNASGEYFKGIAEGGAYLGRSTTDRRQDEYFSSSLASGLGQATALMVVSGAVGGAARAVGAGGRIVTALETSTIGMTGAAVSGWNTYQEALRHGADEETARIAAGMAALVGASEIVPVWKIANRFRFGATAPFMKVLGRAFFEAAESGVQSFGQQYFNDLIAQRLYDKYRDVFDQAEKASGGALAKGAILSLLSSAAARGRTLYMRPRLAPKLAEAQAVAEPMGVEAGKGIENYSLSNLDARDWYEGGNGYPGKNPPIRRALEMYRTAGKSWQEQAMVSYSVRNVFRTKARDLMSDRPLAERLMQSEKNFKWEELYEKYNGNYDLMIAASLRSRKNVRKNIVMQEKVVKT